MDTWIAPKPRHWSVYSPKLGKDLYLDSTLEYEFESLIIFDPTYPSYEIHSPKVEVWVSDRLVKTSFDFTLIDKKGGFHLREIKLAKQLASIVPGSRLDIQMRAQHIYTDLHDIDYNIITDIWLKERRYEVDNCRLMRHHLSVHRDKDTTDLEAELELRLPLRDGKTLDQLTVGLDASQEEVKVALYRLIMQGIAERNFTEMPLSNRTLYRRGRNEHSEL